MIDFHSHVLPAIDDGAKNVSESLEMLKSSYSQGVRTVVATPHCYLMQNGDIENFLSKRERSYKILCEAMEKDGGEFPEIKLGCELRILREIDDMDELKKLCIQDTDYILVEMPYKKWDINYYDFLFEMTIKGLKPIMAHIERFWVYKKKFENLYVLDLIYQINAESVISKPYKKCIPQLFCDGAVQLLGSDMHNMDKRPSYMLQAIETVEKVYGRERLEYLQNNARLVLDNKDVERIKFGKLGFFGMIKI